MKTWLSKKNVKSLFLMLLALITILSLLFTLVKVSVEEYGYELYSYGESGFNLLAFDSDIVGTFWEDDYVAIISIWPLLTLIIGVISFAFAFVTLFISNVSVANKMQKVFSILCVIAITLTMIDGIVFSTVLGIEWSYSFSTFSYIPLIIGVLVYLAYLIVPSIVCKNEVVIEGKTTKAVGSVKSQSSSIKLLKEYKELLDAGIISQEEFEEKKKTLL